ncbi:MAG TPA: ribonuclease P protein component [Bacteroidia bacterium]|nr:ribonuclease P protein component [Bacteroidia bacterium]
MGNKFYKQERLCSRKQIDLLFQKNKSSVAFPLKAVHIETATELLFPAQVMFVVPKRNFKKAHDRNTIRRRMREAYRLAKNSFYDKLKLQNKKLLVALIYTGKKEENYAVIETAVLKVLNSITR